METGETIKETYRRVRPEMVNRRHSYMLDNDDYDDNAGNSMTKYGHTVFDPNTAEQRHCPSQWAITSR